MSDDEDRAIGDLWALLERKQAETERDCAAAMRAWALSRERNPDGLADPRHMDAALDAIRRGPVYQILRRQKDDL